tara:strand:- start:1139 stop:1612 length:474 start_codon:yes stop_codon:yes gene_type:complete
MECKVKRTREDAIIPKKAHRTDTGYDLWVLDKHKELDNGVVMYSTGLQVEPPSGFYFEIVPRSSIIKSGYIQANSIGVVDSGYRGELFVPLLKVDKDSPELELPKKIGQLVLRQVLTCEFVESGSLHQTQRGEGGFGSTDKMDKLGYESRQEIYSRR